MAQVETEAIVFKTYSLSEADKIVVLLTKNHGLIKGVAKGAKRLKSKFGGGLEPFSIVNLLYFQKDERELVTIDNVELRKSYFSAAANPAFFQKFSYFAELLIEFTPPADPNDVLYRMVKVCIETAATDFDSLESIMMYFELWVLKISGYLPNWKNCSECGREIVTDTRDSMLKVNHLLICARCRKSSVDPIRALERNIFFDAQKLSPADFCLRVCADHESVAKLSVILKRIISLVLGKELFGEKVLAATLPRTNANK